MRSHRAPRSGRRARLAACVSVVAGVLSTYRWEGEVVVEPEHMLIIKTAPSRVEDLRARVLAEHPYDVPELLVLEASGVPAPYAAWLDEALATPPSGPPSAHG